MTGEEWNKEMSQWQEERRELDKKHEKEKRISNDRWNQLMHHKPEEPCQKP